ncbi:hypothetical protein [Micrococcus luteus]|uniref:hypothetical protein n=1 Tax=Micrococcus luteus TaxID=1270 RepID=UPI0011A1036F|nr:hypothetical protein [Micrococcus luteus]
MTLEQFFDPTAWIENFWIPAVLLVASAFVGGIWRWVTNRRSERHKASAAARLVVSREFAKVATQIGSLRMYEFGGQLYDAEVLAQKQDECLEVILRTGYGPAAKVARNAGDATLSRLAVTATSMTVGNLDLFARSYKGAQLEYLHGHTSKTPGQRIDLAAWMRTYTFATKVLDPHRFTALGFLRLALTSQKRTEDVIRADGHTPKKASLLARLKWIFSS